MRRISWGLLLGTWTLASTARADLPNTAPIYGSDNLEAIGAALEQSVSAPRQNDSNDSRARDEAERRLRVNGDAIDVALGSMATSVGATMLIGGIGLASSSNWKAIDCPACLPSVILIGGGVGLTLMGLFSLGDYGRPHLGRHHHRDVDVLVAAMSHSSARAANAARRSRSTVAWLFLASGLLLAGSSVTLFAMGHQSGFDDDAREALAAGGALAGGWLATIGSSELAARGADELALAPTRGGGMVSYQRRW